LWLLRGFAMWGMLALGLMAVGADRPMALLGAAVWMIVMSPLVLAWTRKRPTKTKDGGLH